MNTIFRIISFYVKFIDIKSWMFTYSNLVPQWNSLESNFSLMTKCTRWSLCHGDRDTHWNRSQLVPIEFKSVSSYVKHNIIQKLETLYTSNFSIKEIKSRTIISDKGAVKNYQWGRLQILKYCKIKKLWPSLYISIKNCDPPNAMDQKLVTLPSVTC